MADKYFTMKRCFFTIYFKGICIFNLYSLLEHLRAISRAPLGAQEADLWWQLLFSWDLGSKTQQFLFNTACRVYCGAGGAEGAAAAGVRSQLLLWAALPWDPSPSDLPKPPKGRASPGAGAACAGPGPLKYHPGVTVAPLDCGRSAAAA